MSRLKSLSQDAHHCAFRSLRQHPQRIIQTQSDLACATNRRTLITSDKYSTQSSSIKTQKLFHFLGTLRLFRKFNKLEFILNSFDLQRYVYTPCAHGALNYFRTFWILTERNSAITRSYLYSFYYIYGAWFHLPPQERQPSQKSATQPLSSYRSCHAWFCPFLRATRVFASPFTFSLFFFPF